MTGPIAELVFTIEAQCEPPVSLGKQDGGESRMIPIVGGNVCGPKLTGDVLPGADWSIMRESGVATVEARYAIKADDGTIIQVFNGVTERIDPATMANGSHAMVTSPCFIAPDGPHDWLNRGVYVGTLTPDMSGGDFAVRIDVYKMR